MGHRAAGSFRLLVQAVCRAGAPANLTSLWQRRRWMLGCHVVYIQAAIPPKLAGATSSNKLPPSPRRLVAPSTSLRGFKSCKSCRGRPFHMFIFLYETQRSTTKTKCHSKLSSMIPTSFLHGGRLCFSPLILLALSSSLIRL